MALDVLQPVQRRRRRRRRGLRPLAAAALVALLAASAAGVWRLHTRSKPPPARAAPSPAPPAPSPPAEHASTPRLLVGPGALLEHRFRPGLHARAAILVDARTGAVLWARRPHRRLPIASTTKIMTALLALERLRPKEVVRIDPSVPRAAPFREGLRAGERVPTWKLLYGLMLYSGNDDALALAIAAGGSRPAFVHAMNAEGRRLGLRDTHFSTPSGVVDRDNHSSAWDLAALTRDAMRNPRFRAVVRTRIRRVAWPAPTFSKVYLNKNRLLGTYPGADGVKTGWTTRARHCLVASARRGHVRLIAVVLGSTNAFRDARRLLDLGFRSVG
jgi:D-alanyl-D-alanine carboxypeptidase (penicillin-binding protein 5/6)